MCNVQHAIKNQKHHCKDGLVESAKFLDHVSNECMELLEGTSLFIEKDKHMCDQCHASRWYSIEAILQ